MARLRPWQYHSFAHLALKIVCQAARQVIQRLKIKNAALRRHRHYHHFTLRCQQKSAFSGTFRYF
jgi:hypothetical protein